MCQRAYFSFNLMAKETQVNSLQAIVDLKDQKTMSVGESIPNSSRQSVHKNATTGGKQIDTAIQDAKKEAHQ